MQRYTVQKEKICNTFSKILICRTLLIFSPLLLYLYRLSTFDLFTISKQIGYTLAGVWTLYIGPKSIYSFELQYINLYNNLINKTNINNKQIVQMFKISMNKFKKINITVCIVFKIIILTLLLDTNNLKPYGLYGFTDYMYWIFILEIIIVINMVSYGVARIVTNIDLIFKLVETIDWLEYDITINIKSLEIFGDFFFKSTMNFSTGTFFIPILLDFAFTNKLYSIYLIMLILLYTMSILGSYFIPYITLKKSVDSIKSKLYNKEEYKYLELYKQFNKDTNMVMYQKLIATYNHMNYIEKLEFDIMNIKRLITIITCSILPIISIVVDIMINNIEINR